MAANDLGRSRLEINQIVLRHAGSDPNLFS